MVRTTFLIESGFNVYVTAQPMGNAVATVERKYLDKAKIRGELRGRYRKKRLYRNPSPNANANAQLGGNRP